MQTNIEYRTVKLEVYQDKESGAWFYYFPFDWSRYFSNRGYAYAADAREEGEKHIDRVLRETSFYK